MGKCLSLTNNAGGETIMDLLSWVHLVVREEWMAEVFDPQMVEMPQIAMVCTLVVSDQQLRMGQVAKMIEEVVGVEGSCPHDSFDLVSDSLSILEDAGRVSFLQIVEKLLIVVVADADVSVLQSVFLSQHGNGGFDEFLAQVDSLSAIFVALNDGKECLHMQFEEKQKLLEEQRAEIQASLAMAENTLIEARKQYDLMLQGKQLELTKHLKEISQRNDQIEVLLGKTEKFDDLMVVVAAKGRQLETIKHDGKPWIWSSIIF